jgi:hypothetical protein
MSDCSKHKKEVGGISDMKVLAEAIGDLHYEALAEFLECLRDKIYADAGKDYDAGRYSLGGRLNHAAFFIGQAHLMIERAWKISEPFMNSSTQHP